MLEKLLNNLNNILSSIGNAIVNFSDGVMTVLGFIWDILETLRFGLTSLLTGVIDIAFDILGGIGGLVYYAWNSIGELIGGPATVILASLFVIILVRIGVAFVFKLFRLNIDYHSLQSRNKSWNQQDKLDRWKNTPGLFD